MKFELIGKNNLLDPINQVFKNRGVEDIEAFLNPSEDVIHHWSEYKNMKEAATLLLEHLKKGSVIYTPTDSDMDGVTSNSLLINYLKRIKPDVDIRWSMPNSKEHGVDLKRVPEDANLVIITDAGSMQIEEHLKLKTKGIDVIVIDHHEANEESWYATVVNSQFSDVNKQLSGVGMVYKFCKALDEMLGLDYADDYLDLVAFGNVADVMNMKSDETRLLVDKGLANVKNKMLLAIIEKQSYSLKGKLNKFLASFYIIPLVNACIRAGEQEEKELMFRGFLETDEEVYYSRGKVYEDIYTNVARMLTNIKSRQKREVDKGVALIEERIKEKSLLNNKVLIVDVTENLSKDYTGLVANKLIERFQRPAMLLRYDEKNNSMKGSVRGYEKIGLDNFKEYVVSTGLVEKAEGHANAFGVEVTVDKIVDLNNYMNDNIYVNKQKTILVDFLFTGGKIPLTFIKSLHDHNDLWGHGIEQPLIGATVTVNSSDIYLNGTTTKRIEFKVGEVKFVKLFSKEEEFDALVSKGERLTIDLIGTVNINEWQGEQYAQFLIKDMEVTGTHKKQLLF